MKKSAVILRGMTKSQVLAEIRRLKKREMDLGYKAWMFEKMCVEYETLATRAESNADKLRAQAMDIIAEMAELVDDLEEVLAKEK
jgi:uncharacterized protein with PhoU and TrkA domain